MQITREQQFIILGLIFVILIGGGVTFYRKCFPAVAEQKIIDLVPLKEEGMGEVVSIPDKQIVVYLCGEVRKEGVYKVKEGSRLADLIRLAGGITSCADLANLNLASLLKDGDKITVPVGQRVIMGGSEGIKKVNLNTASLDQLKTVSGIGPTTAQKIIDYRKTHGPFSKPEDLLKIPRFGKARLEQVKDFISIY
ncbi:MAG: ComEA family DNA-binding protein [Candidatus Saganbacteria bacterium]|nr:ComEA family DNA-binding protein [Candidatus Saganbacteria bacterium]